MSKVEKTVEKFDAVSMLKENGANKTVVKLTERKNVRMIKDTYHLKAGRVVTPHVVVADAFIKQGIAEEVKE